MMYSAQTISEPQTTSLHNKVHTSSSDTTQLSKALKTIDDPLWQLVCLDALETMGSIGLKLCDCTLSEISSTGKEAYISCLTADDKDFIDWYSFIVLASIQKYFPRVSHVQAYCSGFAKAA